MELEGIDPTTYSDPVTTSPSKHMRKTPFVNHTPESRLIDKFMALTVLISSQIMLVSRNKQPEKGIVDGQSF
jgi:hypothetical protein